MTSPSAAPGTSVSARWPRRTQNVRTQHLAGIAGTRIASALAVIAGIIGAGQFALFLVRQPFYPDPTRPALAWALIVASYIAGAIWVALRGGLLTVVMLATLSIPVAAGMWLDLGSSWGHLDRGVYPTAAMSVAALAIPVAALRRPATLAVIAGLVSLVLTVWVIAQISEPAGWVVPALLLVPWAAYPSLPAMVVVDLFRQMIRDQSDFAAIFSTVELPPRPTGMFASERLSELDTEAEHLLAEVGRGAAIDSPISERAARLANDLRLALIEERRDTWLSIAVSESEYLRRPVSVDDPEGLASRLTSAQREALLAAVWDLCHVRTPGTRVEIALRAEQASTLEVDITVRGLARYRINTTLWRLLDVLGPRVVHFRRGEISIRLSVSTPSTLTSAAVG